ncbi:putative conserved membrane protein [Synechococcus sp. RS9902]|nr:putative conserved membrane protein [Synechococcus sp. RS9902]
MQRPEPLQTSWTLALLLVFVPAAVLAAWLLVASPQVAAGETRESDDCDQETH